MNRQAIKSILFAAVGQVALLLATIYVTRALPEQALDQYGVLFQVFTIGIILGTLRLDQGLLYANSKTDIASLSVASFVVILPTCCVLALAIFIYLANTAIYESSALWLSIAAMMAVSGAVLARALVQFCAANQAFGVVAASSLVRPMLLAVAQLISVSVLRPSIALPFALVFSQLLYAGILAAAAAKDLRAILPLSSLKSVKRAAWDNRKFSLYSLPQNLAYVIGESIVPLTMPIKFPGAGGVAFYWLASRVVFAPATVFAESIRAIVYRKIYNERKAILGSISKIGGLFLLAFSIPPIVLLAWGEQLFETVFGAHMAPASDIAFVLSLLVTFNMATLTIVGALPILDLQRAHMIFEFSGLAIRGAMAVFVPWEDLYSLVSSTTAAYLFVMSLFYGYAIFRAMKYQRRALYG